MPYLNRFTKFKIHLLESISAAIPTSVDIIGVFVLDASIIDWGDVSCNGENDGFINVSSVTGGTPPFTYDWYIDSTEGLEDFDSDGQNEALYTSSELDPNLINLQPGIYSLIITDSNDCEFLVPEINTVIAEPDSLVAFIFETTDVLCYGTDSGAVTYIVSGGTPPYSLDADLIEINDNNEYFYQNTSLFAGSFSTLIIDSNGCETELDSIIGEPDPISVFPETTNVSCFGISDGAVIYDISGGTPPYDYEEPTELSAGFYTDTIIDFAGCEFVFDFEITEPDTLILTAETTDPSCVGFDDGTVIYKYPPSFKYPLTFLKNCLSFSMCSTTSNKPIE